MFHVKQLWREVRALNSLLAGSEDVIAAISTPHGVGGIAIIRISGGGAFDVAAQVFAPASSWPMGRDGWRARYGRIHGPSGEFIDEAIMLTMPAPHSYTREDVVELSCHGGPAVASAVLSAVLRCGVRMAAPGEFTKRAFLNGRIGLDQAEAILSMVNARTERAREAASRFLRGGGTGGDILAIKERAMMLAAGIEAWLDFPEDDVPPMDAAEIADACSELAVRLRVASEEAAMGRILREGLSVAIVGRPNVGKSRLLNALLRQERAIVAEEPGTTRDLVSEVASIRGIPVTLVDSAGMRDCADRVEALGIERARNLLVEADIVLAVLDGAWQLSPEDLSIIEATDVRRSIIVLNKADIEAAFDDDEAAAIARGRPWLRVSALTGAGIESLELAIEAVATSGALHEGGDGSGLSRRRIDCMIRAARSLRDAETGALSGHPLDMISIDLRAALDALSELTGDTASEDVVDLVFSKFCVGK